MKTIPKQVALLGTSADPPTLGHQALLQGLLTLFPKVATWASDNPIKTHGASLEERYNLLRELVETIQSPSLELAQDLSSPWTITTLERASKKWPNAELVFVIGSDLARHVPKWLEARSILKKARLGIAPREGWPIENSDLNNLKSLGGRVELLPLKIPHTASSEARNKLQTHQIPSSILRVLKKQNLYGLNLHKK